MSNPASAFKGMICDYCLEKIHKGDNVFFDPVFFDNGGKFCQSCAEDNRVVCHCGKHKDTESEECLKCSRFKRKMIKSGCPNAGIVLDPFSGAGTTCLVAKKLGRVYIGIELSQKYAKMAKKRIEFEAGTLL